MCWNSSGVDIKNLDIAIVKTDPAALEVRVQIVLMTEVLPTEFLLPIMLQKGLKENMLGKIARAGKKLNQSFCPYAKI